MKKIGKNTKLYLIGMIIGGITLGITTVIADTIINSTSVAYKTTTVKAALDELYDIADFKEEVKDMLYPVGSIYISVSSTNPSELFGGTWVSFGMGRTLMGVGTVEANTHTLNGNVSEGEYTVGNVESRGGESKHTLSVAELPAHSHPYHYIPLVWAQREKMNSSNLNTKTYALQLETDITQTGWIGGDRVLDGTTTKETGGNVAFNVQAPYISVYMWKRTA